MTYNNEIHAFAPLPTGALPTANELQQIAARSRRRQVDTVLSSLRRVFRR